MGVHRLHQPLESLPVLSEAWINFGRLMRYLAGTKDRLLTESATAYRAGEDTSDELRGRDGAIRNYHSMAMTA